MKLQALVKSTINKQWAPFKDTGEIFRLCRVRTEDSRTSFHMGRSLFTLFCLSEIRANDASSLEWLKRFRGIWTEKLPGFQAAWVPCSDFCACEPWRSHLKTELFESAKGIIILYSSSTNFSHIFKRWSKEIKNTF